MAELDLLQISACYAVGEYLVIGEAEGGEQHVAWVLSCLDHAGAVQVQNGIARAVQAAQAKLTPAQRATRRLPAIALQEPPAEEETKRRKGLPHEYMAAPSYRSDDSDSQSSRVHTNSVYGVPMAQFTAVPMAPPTGSVRRRAAVEDGHDDGFGSVIDALRSAAAPQGQPGPPREAFTTEAAAQPNADARSVSSRSDGRPGFEEQDTMAHKAAPAAEDGDDADADSMVLDLDDIADSEEAQQAAASPGNGTAYLKRESLDTPGYLDTRHIRPGHGEQPQYADVDGKKERSPYLEVTELRPEPSRGASGEGQTGGYLDVSRNQRRGEDHGSGYLDVSRDRSHTERSDTGGYLDVRTAVPEDSSGRPVSQAYLDTHHMAPGDASQDPSPSKAPPSQQQEAGGGSAGEADDDDFGDLAYVLQAEGHPDNAGDDAEADVQDFAAEAESMLRRLSISGHRH